MSEPEGKSQNEQAEFLEWVGKRLELVASDLHHGDVESAGHGLRNVAVAIREKAEEMEDIDQ